MAEETVNAERLKNASQLVSDALYFAAGQKIEQVIYAINSAGFCS